MGELAARLAALTHDDLRPVVRAALHDPNADLLQWMVEIPGWLSANPITRGVARVHGKARTGSGSVAAWTVVLKIIGPVELPTTREPHESNYWRREADALDSGLVDQRAAPFVPVDLLVPPEPRGEEVWLWLECLDSNDSKKSWGPEDRRMAAYDLGAFNAIWSSDPPSPDTYPWLAQHWLRGWIEYGRAFGVDYSLAHEECWRHPLIAAALPHDTHGRFARLMINSKKLLALLDALPVTLTHHDAQWRNLFLRQDQFDHSRPHGRTVAVDWSFLGLAPVGADLGHMIGCDLQLGVVQPRESEDVIAAYLEGLAAHGWQGTSEPSASRGRSARRSN